MATASVTYTFVNGAPNDGAPVTQNFTDILNFLNTQVVHKDGAVTMSGALTLPSSDPTTGNQATRKSYVDASLPIGMIVQFAGSTVPVTTSPAWKLCDGTAVSRTTYASLFTAIGTTYGAGDGSTTFNLPDLRGRVPVGSGTGSGLTARSLGAKGGGETLPAHTHAITGYNIAFSATSSIGLIGDGRTNDATFTTGVTTNSTGTGSHGVMQPFVVVNFLIKVA